MVITRFKSSSAFRATVALFLVVLCLSLSACGRSTSADIDPQAEYNAAVQDARNMTAEKISKDLTAIVPENKSLKWENDAPGPRVLVATLLGNQSACEGYMDPDTTGCKADSE